MLCLCLYQSISFLLLYSFWCESMSTTYTHAKQITVCLFVFFVWFVLYYFSCVF